MSPRASVGTLLKRKPSLDTLLGARYRETRGFNTKGSQFIQDAIDDVQRRQDVVMNDKTWVEESILKTNEDISRVQVEIDRLKQSLLALERQIVDVNAMLSEINNASSETVERQKEVFA